MINRKLKMAFAMASPLKRGARSLPRCSVGVFLILFVFMLSLPQAFTQNNLIDSLKNELQKQEKEPQNDAIDTLKITILFQLVEYIYDDNVWPKFNDLAFKLATKLESSNNEKVKKFAKKSLVDAHNNKGYFYKIRGNIKYAITNYLTSLKKAQQINYLNGEASALINLSTLLSQQKQYDEALKYCRRALDISYKINDKTIEAISVQSIANHFMIRLQYDSAEVYLLKSISISEELNDKNRLAESYNSAGVLFYRTGRSNIALEQHFKALELFRQTNNQIQLANTYYNISSLIYKFQHNKSDYTKALEYLDSSLYFSKINNYIESVSDNYLLKSTILTSFSELESLSLNEKLNLTQQALESFKLHKTFSDSIFNKEVLNNTVKQQLNFEFDKKEAQLKIEQEKKEVIANANKKRQQLFIWFLLSIIIAVTIISILVFRTLRTTKKQKHIIEKQKELVEQKQKEILDSIHYAKRIQDAILTPLSYIDRNLKRLKSKK